MISRMPEPAPQSDSGRVTDWNDAPLSLLCDHIVSVHHARTREGLERLTGLVSGAAAPLFGALRTEVEEHMREEETRLFPAMTALEQHDVDGFPLETIEAYEAHHVRTGAAIRELRRLLAGEPDALAALEELDADLHRHIHEENEVLFPRALAALGRAY